MSRFTCQQCGDQFFGHPANPGRARKYCSRQCAQMGARTESYSKNYRKISAIGHPLADKNGRAFEHRVVLWDKIGPGTHPCHHCGVAVTWAPGQGCSKGALVTDHLDRDRQNNRTENLVPSCQRCNTLNQEKTVADSEVHVVRPTGSRLRGELRTCATCGGSFVARSGGQGRVGIYCSPECVHRRNSPPAPRTCQQCGKQFIRPYATEAKYCSQACFRNAPKVNSRTPNRVCLQCGALFHKKGNRPAKYCTFSCYNTARSVKART